MNELHIDKTHWKKYRFDEMVQNIAERVEPSQTDLDVYVGLEHIDPDCLHLSRHGHPSDVEGTKLRFYKGDIIFGRRRAYQRKTALATTDGICSAHAMVVRAKEDVVDPMFLPFLFHSKSFIDMAITISVGGLSPTINWKDIAKQEFLLPPNAEQKRLAELLWAADEVVEKEKREMERMEKLLEIDVANTLGYCKDGQYEYHKQQLIKISEVITKEKFEIGKLDTEQYQLQGKYPIIDQSKSFIAGYSDFNDLVFKGTLPVIVFGDHTTIVKFVDFPFILGADGTKIIKANEELVTTKYLYYTIKNLHIVPQGYRRHFSILKEFEIPLFSIEKQEKFVTRWDKLEDLLARIGQQIETSQQIKQELINKVF
ncbi:MAG: restriction endonuclease subunit S [Bacteroidales bacterium]|nr:restriction endonuclease subunit S [Bacteroidales bacterium]